MVIEVSAMEVASTILRRPSGARADGAILRRALHRAVERADVDARVAHILFEPRRQPQDFGLSGQKDENGARLLGQGAPHGAGGGLLDPLARVAAEIERLDRKGAALRFDDGGVAHQAGDAGAVERRRHHDKAKVRPQRRLRVERQGKAEIGVERAFVEFVEQHRRDAVERRDRRGSCGRKRPR